jgi:hypothetical protein
MKISGTVLWMSTLIMFIIILFYLLFIIFNYIYLRNILLLWHQ